ncbi:NAD(P)-dependent oxidoreductase [Bradyrhizobium sp. WSM1743]|uniref:NAD-dependent epimerase/dehydratase family protein n=1 Tax=Bradyrhizobium sp. WSM1743 TaxID=318996 RepID=UPI0006850E74|nr:SDR family oxidoreductase [Bradyrhizobium sp. WSM1743]
MFMKTILVTGAGGYIGTVMVEHLLAQGHKVIGVDRFYFGKGTLGSETFNNQRFTLVQKDIRDLTPDDFRGVDVAIDLAGLSNDPTCDLKPKLTYNINFKGGINVAECAKRAKVPRYIYSSSCSVYGMGATQQLAEAAEPNPQSYYARGKVDVERRLLEIADDEFCVTVLRNATVYGLSKRMRFDLVINLMTLKAWKERKIFVLGGGKQWRPLVHVKDVVRGFEAVMDAPEEKVAKQIFNLGSNEQNYQVVQIANIIKEFIPSVEIIQVPDDPDKRTYNVNFDKIKNTLGFQAEFSARDGTKEIVEALNYGVIDPDDPRTRTIEHYRFLLRVEDTMAELGKDGRIF